MNDPREFMNVPIFRPAMCNAGANICEKLSGTDRSGEARRAESGGWVLGEGGGS